MQRWEYRWVVFKKVTAFGKKYEFQNADGDRSMRQKKGQEMQEYIAAAGLEGWELVSLGPIGESTHVTPPSLTAVLKRPRS